MQEIWKDIENYEGLYKISNLGRIKSFPRNTNKKIKYLKMIKRKDGYCTFALTKDGITKIYYVHRLVAKTFIPNLKNKPQINHIDGNKQNNRVSNLEWCTAKENIKHSFENKLQVIKKGRSNPLYGRYSKAKNCIKVIQYDKNYREINRYGSISEASKKNNICYSSIYKCCYKKRNFAGNYIWKMEKGEYDEN